MNLKKQIAVIVLALTATTSPVWSQDKQALQSPTAQSLQGTWRVTRTVVDCITGQDILSFPPIKTYNQGGTYTGYGVPRWRSRSRDRIRCLAARARQSELLGQSCGLPLYPEGDFDGRVEATDAYGSPRANSFDGTAQSSSSTPTAI